MLKLKLTKAEFDALPDGLKVAYLADGDNYKLAVDGYEDPGELRRARDREKEAARLAKEERDALKAEVEGLKLNPAREAKDIKTLEEAWKRKYDADISAEQARTAAATKRFGDHLLQSEARKFAAEIAAKPESVELLLPHIMTRLEVGDEGVVRIKDKTGRVSAMNFDELKKEYIETPMFGSVVAASKASGAGGTGSSTPSGGAGKGANRKFSDWTEAERTELFRSNPAEFARLSEASKVERFAIR